jgi:kumamolisin
VTPQVVAHLSHGHRLGALTQGRIGFALNLRLHERQLDAYLARVHPADSSRPALTARQFGARFGESDAQLARLRTVLGQLGISVVKTYPQRTEMQVSAGIARLRNDFGLRFGRYETADGRRYFAPERTPQIPHALTPYISGVGDLSNAPLLTDDVPASGLTPQVTARAYDIAPLWQRGDDGRGQTLAIASLYGAVNPNDVSAFSKHYGVPAPDITIKPVDGGSRYDAQAGSDGEVDLDLQVAAGIAPRAHIIDYQGSESQSLGHGLADIYNAIEQDGQAKVVSTSYGLCEAIVAAQSPGDPQLIDNALKAMEASNITVFIATGDSGAYACLQALTLHPATAIPAALRQLSVQTPSSSPYAVSVGGTSLSVRADGSYLAESAWSNPLERSGGGGGQSLREPRPAWQQGPGVATAAPNPSGRRQTPDVAGPADSFAGFGVCTTAPGQSSASCAGGNGGTSAAAPFWAASMLLVQQYAKSHGAGKLATCFAGPVLYDLAATRQPVAPFHQVVYGNDGYYPAKPGWNYATGLGSPDVFNLAQDYAALLHKRSSRTCPF